MKNSLASVVSGGQSEESSLCSIINLAQKPSYKLFPGQISIQRIHLYVSHVVH